MKQHTVIVSPIKRSSKFIHYVASLAQKDKQTAIYPTEIDKSTNTVNSGLPRETFKIPYGFNDETIKEAVTASLQEMGVFGNVRIFKNTGYNEVPLEIVVEKVKQKYVK